MDRKVTLEAINVDNWLKICNLSVNDKQKAIFTVPNVYWIGISRYDENASYAVGSDTALI